METSGAEGTIKKGKIINQDRKENSKKIFFMIILKDIQLRKWIGNLETQQSLRIGLKWIKQRFFNSSLNTTNLFTKGFKNIFQNPRRFFFFRFYFPEIFSRDQKKETKNLSQTFKKNKRVNSSLLFYFS